MDGVQHTFQTSTYDELISSCTTENDTKIECSSDVGSNIGEFQDVKQLNELEQVSYFLRNIIIKQAI